MHNHSIAKLAKEKGNIAFEAKDYATARSLYSHAITFNPLNHIYPLNRSQANLKLERWDEAEADATKTLGLSPRNLKALLRRGRARKELGKWDEARVDIQTLIDIDGDPTLTGAEELKAIAEAEHTPRSKSSSHVSRGLKSNLVKHRSQDASAFGIYTASTSQKGEGSFTSRDIQKDGLIMSERPIFSMPAMTNVNAREPLTHFVIETAVRKLSPAHLDGLLSLENSHDKCSCFRSHLLGVIATNSFAVSEGDSGICLTASRFNHSCSPNAHYCADPFTGQLHFLALRTIPRGEEVCISYTSRRTVYGSPRRSRQGLLRLMYHFTCACSVCSLSKAESELSDTRRQRLNELWVTLGRLAPTLEKEGHGVNAVHAACLEGVRLFQEEGDSVDVEGFMNEAGPM